MATPQNRQWGVTPPISMGLPSDAELAANDALIAELKRQNNFEGSDETEKRYLVFDFDEYHQLISPNQKEYPSINPEDNGRIRQTCQ